MSRQEVRTSQGSRNHLKKGRLVKATSDLQERLVQLVIMTE